MRQLRCKEGKKETHQNSDHCIAVTLCRYNSTTSAPLPTEPTSAVVTLWGPSHLLYTQQQDHNIQQYHHTTPHHTTTPYHLMLTVSRFIHHHHPNQFLCVDVLFVCVCSDIGVKNYFLSHRDDQHLLNLFSLKLCCTSIYCIKYLFGNYCFQLLCSNLSMQILYLIFSIIICMFFHCKTNTCTITMEIKKDTLRFFIF